MIARCKGLRVTIQLVAITYGVGAPVVSAREQAQPPPAAMRIPQPGHEEEQLRQRSGTWTVVSTFRPTPDSTPIVSDGLMAERTMVGLYMREVMTPGVAQFDAR